MHNNAKMYFKFISPDLPDKSRNWYVALYRRTQYIGPDSQECGTINQSCFHLNSVMNQISDGDTVVLTSGDDTEHGKLFVRYVFSAFL